MQVSNVVMLHKVGDFLQYRVSNNAPYTKTFYITIFSYLSFIRGAR